MLGIARALCRDDDEEKCIRLRAEQASTTGVELKSELKSEMGSPPADAPGDKGDRKAADATKAQPRVQLRRL